MSETYPCADFLEEARPHPHWNGVQLKYRFPNGYGASVIRAEGSYGYADGRWELAVLKAGKLCYTTGITEDVLGHLTLDDVDATLAKIAALPTEDTR